MELIACENRVFTFGHVYFSLLFMWLLTDLDSVYSQTGVCRIQCDCNYARQIDYWNNVTNQEKQQEELEKTLTDIRKKLSMEKTNLTSEKIKLFSAEDSRQSSKIIGIGGIMIILALPVFLIMMDLTSICKSCHKFHIKNKPSSSGHKDKTPLKQDFSRPNSSDDINKKRK